MILYIYNIAFCLIVGPISEWAAHLLLHKTNNFIHNNHHENYNNNEVSLEVFPIVISYFAYSYGHNFIVYAYMRYWIIHSLIHFYPEILPRLSKHHLTHHKYKNYNFAVSSRWPDYVFGTLYTKDNLKNKDNQKK